VNTREILSSTIKGYEESLPTSIDLAGLLSRNAIAHKWKVTYCLLVIRECVFWRFVDIVKQALRMGSDNFIVGARILTRASIETLSTLIYANFKMEDVVSGKLDFGEFGETVERILLGSKAYKDAKTPESINVLTMISKCNEKHNGILAAYEDLCETAHPSFIGLTDGYSKIDQANYETKFGNYWIEKCEHQHEDALLKCTKIFEDEYNNVWIKNMEALEKWLVQNDEALEKRRKLFKGKK
jgi:hypothetical protein